MIASLRLNKLLLSFGHTLQFPEESEAEPAASDGDQGGTGGAAAWGRRHSKMFSKELFFCRQRKNQWKSSAKYHFPLVHDG